MSSKSHIGSHGIISINVYIYIIFIYCGSCQNTATVDFSSFALNALGMTIRHTATSGS